MSFSLDLLEQETVDQQLRLIIINRPVCIKRVVFRRCLGAKQSVLKDCSMQSNKLLDTPFFTLKEVNHWCIKN